MKGKGLSPNTVEKREHALGIEIVKCLDDGFFKDTQVEIDIEIAGHGVDINSSYVEFDVCLEFNRKTSESNFTVRAYYSSFELYIASWDLYIPFSRNSPGFLLRQIILDITTNLSLETSMQVFKKELDKHRDNLDKELKQYRK